MFCGKVYYDLYEENDYPDFFVLNYCAYFDSTNLPFIYLWRRLDIRV